MNKNTPNSIKYNFSDFTLNQYHEIIEEARKHHQFSSYHDFNKEENFLVNRHDIDFSIENAKSMAEIESSLEVTSTFFVMLHSEYYSFFERKTIDLLKDIISLGHNIGLHFDAKFYNINEENELNSKIAYEKSILEYYLECDVKVFSFHNTTEFTMSCKNWSYGGLINTYADYFQSNVMYCSDSNGYWRFDRMIDFLKTNYDRPIQLLTHPVWWTKDINSPRQKILDCVKQRCDNNIKEYEKILSLFGRVNIDW